MKTRNAAIRMLAIVCAVLLALVIIYPKPWVVGGLEGGPIEPGRTAYQEEYWCAGLKLVMYPVNCADCAAQYPCFGITFHKTCSIERYDSYQGFTTTPVPCR